MLSAHIQSAPGQDVAGVLRAVSAAAQTSGVKHTTIQVTKGLKNKVADNSS